MAARRGGAAALHWSGNLLAKLGRFAEALPFLEKARRLEERIPPRGDKKIEIDQDLKDQLRALGYVK